MRRLILACLLTGFILLMAGCSPADQALIREKVAQSSWPAVSMSAVYEITMGDADLADADYGYTLTMRGTVNQQDGTAALVVKGISNFPYLPSIDTISLYVDAEGCTYLGKDGMIQLLYLLDDYDMAEALERTAGDYVYFLPEAFEDIPVSWSAAWIGTNAQNYQDWLNPEVLAVLLDIFNDVDLGVTQSGDAYTVKLDQNTAASQLDKLFRVLAARYEDVLAVLPLDASLRAELLAVAPEVKAELSGAFRDEVIAAIRSGVFQLEWKSQNQPDRYTDQFTARIEDGSDVLRMNFTLEGRKILYTPIAFPPRTIDAMALMDDLYGAFDSSYGYDDDAGWRTELATISLAEGTVASGMGTWSIDARLVDGSAYVPLIDLSALLFERVYWDGEQNIPYIVYYDDERIDLAGFWDGDVYFVKLRTLEAFEYYLTWDSAAQQIKIEY